MTLVLNDRVLETCTSPGTGSATLLGATTGFRTFSAGVGNGNTCYYTIADQNGGNWEVGLGTYTSSSNSLARTTVLSSSNAGSLVNFSSGTQNVFVTYPAEKAVYLDASGNLTLSGNLTFTNSITTGGHYSQGAFSGTFTDGVVLDYVSGLGRISVGSSDGLSIYNGGVGGTALLNLDSSGNLGLGVTPSAWGASYKAIQLASGSFGAYSSTSISMGQNWYDSGTGAFKYINSSYATNYYQNSGQHIWQTAGSGTAGSAISFTQAMTLTAAGYLGIGTSSPGKPLEVAGGDIRVSQSGSGNIGINILRTGGTASDWYNYIPSGSADLVWYYGGERMRLDSSGNLGLGVTPSAATLPTVQSSYGLFSGSNEAHFLQNCYYNGSWRYIQSSLGACRYDQTQGYHTWQIAGTGTAGAAISFTQAMTLTAGGNLRLNTTSASGGRNFALDVVGFDNTYTAVIGMLSGSTSRLNFYDGTTISFPSLGSTGDNLVLCTGAVERARIDSSGNLLVGTTSPLENANPGMKVLNTGGTIAVVSTANTGGQQGFEMYSTTAGAYRCYIDYAGVIHATTTTISAISDRRLKENIVDLDTGLDAILALKPRRFDWKEGKGKDIKGDRGWIADEFEEVFPDLIDQWKDEPPEGEEPYKSVRPDLMPVLVKAIQELKAELDQLKAQLR